jgi:hypothetical protein
MTSFCLSLIFSPTSQHNFPFKNADDPFLLVAPFFSDFLAQLLFKNVDDLFCSSQLFHRRANFGPSQQGLAGHGLRCSKNGLRAPFWERCHKL